MLFRVLSALLISLLVLLASADDAAAILCGDGVIEAPENCDDLNTDPGDGCDENCRQETGWDCFGEPSVCIEICGNGRITPGEECDDLGTSPGDGCDANCVVEPGFLCFGEPSTCGPGAPADPVLPGERLAVGGAVTTIFRVNPVSGNRIVFSRAEQSSQCAFESSQCNFVGNPDACCTGPGVGNGQSPCESTTLTPFACCTGFETGDGTGECFSTGNGPPFSASEIAIESGGSILVSGSSLVYRVNASTGERTVLSGTVSGGGGGGGPAFSGFLNDLVVESTGQILVSSSNGAIYRVDPVTGDRTIMSGCNPPSCATLVGSGPGFSLLDAIGLEANGNILATGITTTGVLYRVDPVTGNRTIISSGTVGTGGDLVIPADIAVEPAGTILVADLNTSTNLLARVDPVTGDRTVVSSGPPDFFLCFRNFPCCSGAPEDPPCSPKGTGPTFENPRSVFVEPDGKIFMLAHTDPASAGPILFLVNPETGDRTIVSSPTVGSGEPFLGTGPLTAVAGGAVCGDGVITPPETCDDGDNSGGDGCSAVCTIEPGWQCAGAPSVCSEVCGNGIITPSEGCDDNGIVPGDGCDAVCQIESGWTCSGAPSTCNEVCGDGIITPSEGCDDNGTVPGDGCSATCQIESGWTCSGAPSVCGEVCGNGIVTTSEGCDDGGTTPGDGCSATCQIESGWNCSGSPSSCSEVCGDGIITPSEGCDDSGTAPGDGCDATCQIESGWTCSGAPSSCSEVCGNGIITPSEGCDDGATAPDDGCSALCQVEPGFVCGGQPSSCVLASTFPALSKRGVALFVLLALSGFAVLWRRRPRRDRFTRP